MYLLMCEKPSLLSFSEGAVHRTIYFPEVKAFHIALPPVDEQDAIVSRVEELLARCDALESSLRASEAKAARLAEALAAAAVSRKV